MGTYGYILKTYKMTVIIDNIYWMFSNLSPSKFHLTFILTANFYPVLKGKETKAQREWVD